MDALFNALGPGGIAAVIIYFVISLVEIVLAFLELEKARKVVKILCIPPLIAVAAIALPNHPLIYVALIFGWIGDIGMLSRKRIPFFIGNIFFLLEHVAIILEIYLNYQTFMGFQMPFYYPIIFAVVYLVLIGIFAVPTYKMCGSWAQAVLGLNYMIIVIMMALTTMVLSIYHYQWILISFIGYLFFFASDMTIVITTFKKGIKRHHFYIMSTYLIAQFLVVFGFILTYIQ